MRYIYLLAIVGLIFSDRAAALLTNTSPNTNSQRATVHAGPALTVGTTNSADVLVDGRLAMRIAAPAGDLSPMRRATVIADRLNRAFESGASWSGIRVSRIRNEWTVTLGTQVIATADARSAWLMGISTAELASHWARQSVVALGGSPSEIEPQLVPVTSLVAGSTQEFGTPPEPVTWTTATTKRVPLVMSGTGSELGFVMTAGAQEKLDAVTCVIAVKVKTKDGATIYTFVPAVGPGISNPIIEVGGVGIVSIPESIMPDIALATDTRFGDLIKQYAKEWDDTINATRNVYNLKTHEAVRIVPLYSAETGRMVGAAEAMGADAMVQNARSIVMMKSDSTLNLNASLSADTSIAAATSPLENVVVSSIILVEADSETDFLDAEPYPADDFTLPAPPD